MLFGEASTFGGDGIANAAVDPCRVIGLVGDVDGDSLLMSGDVFLAPSGLDVIAEQSSAVPRGLFLDKGEAGVVGAAKDHGEFAVLGDDVRKGVVHGDIGRIGGFDAGLHGGDTDGDVGDVVADEPNDGGKTGGGASEGEDEAFGAGFAVLDGLSGGLAHGGDGAQGLFDGAVFDFSGGGFGGLLFAGADLAIGGALEGVDLGGKVGSGFGRGGDGFGFDGSRGGGLFGGWRG